MSVRIHREQPERLPPIVAVDVGPDDLRPELVLTQNKHLVRIEIRHPDGCVFADAQDALDLGNALIQFSHQVKR